MLHGHWALIQKKSALTSAQVKKTKIANIIHNKATYSRFVVVLRFKKIFFKLVYFSLISEAIINGIQIKISLQSCSHVLLYYCFCSPA